MRESVSVGSAVFLVGLWCSAAAAAPVDNPGNFAWSSGGAQFQFNQSSPVTGSVTVGSGTLDIDLDSAGDIEFNAFTIQSFNVSAGGYTYTVTLQTRVANCSGNLDASVGGWNTSLTLEMRVKLTGGLAVGNNCITPYFQFSAEGAYQYNALTLDGALDIWSGTGGSVGGTTGWVTVPAMTQAACGVDFGIINGDFGFGVANEGLQIIRLGNTTNPGPYGS
jgi:hypothetical protein